VAEEDGVVDGVGGVPGERAQAIEEVQSAAPEALPREEGGLLPRGHGGQCLIGRVEGGGGGAGEGAGGGAGGREGRWWEQAGEVDTGGGGGMRREAAGAGAGRRCRAGSGDGGAGGRRAVGKGRHRFRGKETN